MNASPNPLPPVTLVLGGVRSGKSLYAEGLVEAHVEKGGKGIYLATAEAGDAEMKARIEEHKKRRGKAWETFEEPLDIRGVLADHARPETPVLVDCLTLWLSNVMAADRDVDGEIRALAETLLGVPGPVVLVSNEVGTGIVPDNALARSYMDYAGRMNQAVAAQAGRVVMMTAGLAQTLKDET